MSVEIGQVAIVSIVVPLLVAVDHLTATGKAKPARATPLVYALSALISVLGGYWLSRIFEAYWPAAAAAEGDADNDGKIGAIASTMCELAAMCGRITDHRQ